MSISDFLPNWAILKHPWNWLVVALSLVILIMLLHVFFRNSPLVAWADGGTKEPVADYNR